MIRLFLVRLADAFFLARPLLWIPVWGFCIFGYVSGLRSMGRSDLGAAWGAPFSVSGWMLVFSFSVGAVYVFNQIADRAVDAVNAGFPLLARGNIPLRLAWGAAATLAIASVLIPLGKRPILSLFALLALAVGVAYSARPLYFSGRLAADFLTNAVGYAVVAFGAGWHLAGAGFGATFFLASLPYFFLMCAGSISSTLPDREGDRQCGKKTTAVTLGIAPAHLVASAFIVAGLVSSLLEGDWVAAICAGIAVPLYGAFIFRKTVRTMEATYKVGGMIMMIVAAALYPLLAPVSLLSLLATVVYFQVRFHVRYPSLVPVRPKR